MANKESDDVTKDLVPTVEEKHSSLAAWWDRYKETFSGWYMSLTLDEQTSILRKACPGIPTKCPKSRAQSTLNTLSTDKFETIQPSELSNETTVKSEIATESAALNQFKPTDLLLPELNEESMIALQGKILLLLLGRRLQTPDLCYRADINLLNGQLQKGVLPQLSNGQLDHINTPFVDPMDEEENVRSFGPELTAETRATFKEYFETGRLVRAEVWLCLKVLIIPVTICFHAALHIYLCFYFYFYVIMIHHYYL